MVRQCPNCGLAYNDFDCWTVCPHERFALSESALKLLVESAMVCPRCERHVDECACSMAPYFVMVHGQLPAGPRAPDAPAGPRPPSTPGRPCGPVAPVGPRSPVSPRSPVAPGGPSVACLSSTSNVALSASARTLSIMATKFMLDPCSAFEAGV